MQNSYMLDNFEGPLNFLLHLVRKSEVDIYSVPIREVFEQFMQRCSLEEGVKIDDGSSFVSEASMLMWFKSKMLLPKHESDLEEIELEDDPEFEIIHQLYDYCTFRDTGKKLAELGEKQNDHFTRSIKQERMVEKELGIEHLTMDDLAKLFQNTLTKAKTTPRTIPEENWKVSDKIKWVGQRVKELGSCSFHEIFSPESSHLELIVTFLAVLELMKIGDVAVVKDLQTDEISLRRNNDSA